MLSAMKTILKVTVAAVLILVGAFFWWHEHPHRTDSFPSPEAKARAAGSSTTNSSVPPDQWNAFQPPPPVRPQVPVANIDPKTVAAWRNYNEHERADPSYPFKAKMRFYGQVLDQDENPIADADVHFEWNTVDPQTGDVEMGTATTNSDAAGKFSLEGAIGNQLLVDASKTGYYKVAVRPYMFEFLKSWSDIFYAPDPENPVLFHLRRKGISEPLVTGTKVFRFAPNGTQYYVNLIDGRNGTNSSAEWDLSVRFVRGPLGGNGRFEWSLEMDASDGGLAARTGQFDFVAPESGYHPIQIVQNTNTSAWRDGWEGELFVKSRSGSIYSRIKAVIIDIEDNDAAMDITYFVNPSGSRNLEFDPAKVFPQSP